MRVLLVDPSSRGGIAMYTRLLAEGLREAGATPILLTSRDLPDGGAGYEVVRTLPEWSRTRSDVRDVGFVARQAWNWLEAARTVVATIREVAPDVVHFQAPVNRRLDHLLVRAIRRRVPVVWTAHDVVPPWAVRVKEEGLLFSRLYRSADLVVVHSAAVARALEEMAGVCPAVVDHPAQPALVAFSPAEARQRLGLPPGPRVLAALGYIRANKGYELLADVWERLGPEAPFLLVMGELADRDQTGVLARLRETGRAGVRLGYATDTDMQTATRAADALVLPHRTHDSGLVHMAVGLGVPVIASDTPQLADLVTRTGAGVVVERTVDAWCAAVTRDLPPPPPPPPSLADIGQRHIELYRTRTGRQPRSVHVVVYTDAVAWGGAEESLATLVAHLDPRFRLTVMGTDRSVVERVARLRPGTGTRLVPAVRDKADVLPIMAHVRAIAGLRPDIFQANLRHPFACQYGLLAALLVPRTRVVAVEHLPLAPANERQRAVKRLISSRLDGHVAVSLSSAREVEDLARLPRGSVRTIHNGVEEVPVSPMRRVSPGPVVGSLGRLVEQKGYDVLIRALAALPGVNAVIVGDGEERGRLEALAASEGVADRLAITGWSDEPRSYLPGFDVFCLPSRFEGFPLSIVEAMLAGRPVVASRVGGIPEGVIDGETGILVPPDDPAALQAALDTLLSHPDRGRRMGAAGRARATAAFTAPVMARSFEALYDQLLAAASRSANSSPSQFSTQ